MRLVVDDRELSWRNVRAKQSLAADGAIALLSSNLFKSAWMLIARPQAEGPSLCRFFYTGEICPIFLGWDFLITWDSRAVILD
jgi:hypothetical protein